MGCSLEKWDLNCPMQGNPDSPAKSGKFLLLESGYPESKTVLDSFTWGHLSPLRLGLSVIVKKTAARQDKDTIMKSAEI